MSCGNSDILALIDYYQNGTDLSGRSWENYNFYDWWNAAENGASPPVRDVCATFSQADILSVTLAVLGTFTTPSQYLGFNRDFYYLYLKAIGSEDPSPVFTNFCIGALYDVFSVGASFVFDTYANGLFGVSVRKLKNGEGDPVTNIRRASDNATNDFNLNSSNLFALDSETSGGTSLSSFISSENGFLTDFYDQSGNNNDAGETTAANQPQSLNAGVLEAINSIAAFTFNGSSQRLLVWNNTIAPTEFQSLGSDLTLIARVNPNNVTNSGAVFFPAYTIAEIRQNTSPSDKVPFSFGIDNSKLFIGISSSSGGSETFTSLSNISTLTNYYFGVTISGTTLKFFINGALDSTHTITTETGIRNVGTTNSSFTIGVRTRNGGQADSNYFNGKLNEILLFDTALSDANVISIMNDSNL